MHETLFRFRIARFFFSELLPKLRQFAMEQHILFRLIDYIGGVDTDEEGRICRHHKNCG
jgi:hypothetical protein